MGNKMEEPKGLKILQIIPTPPFAWATGGCARVVYDLSKELAQRGNSITILTTDMYQPNLRYQIKGPEIIDGIRIIRFKNISNRLAWKYKIYISLGMINYLRNHLKEYDVVHLQDLISLQAIATSFYCQKYGIPYISNPHGSIFWLTKKGIINRLYSNLFGSKILKHASKVIALTKTEFDQCKDMGIEEEAIEILPNGIDLAIQNNLPEKGSFKKEYSIKEDSQIILYLGRINKIKGIDLLIESFKDLTTEFNNVELVIVGPDEGFLSELKNQTRKLDLEDKILFTGPLYGEDKFKAFVDADVYVLPSIYETFPISVLEALACAKPVVVTDRCGISDLTCKCGLVVSYDKKQLSEVLLELLKDEKLREKLGLEGKKLVTQRFNWSLIAKDLENLYYKVIG
jgi:glycosyltransferase involved in cell wall biosynthesis